jgi:hypothetical protein
MAAFRRAGTERVNAFAIDDNYLFKHYFEGEEVFARLRQYYNNHQYRFEVPSQEFDWIRAFLDNHGYGLIVVAGIDAFVVVVKKYTAHPNNIFKASVAQRSIDGYNCFLMTDQAAVEQAVKERATRLTDTGFENPF